MILNSIMYGVGQLMKMLNLAYLNKEQRLPFRVIILFKCNFAASYGSMTTRNPEAKYTYFLNPKTDIVCTEALIQIPSSSFGIISPFVSNVCQQLGWVSEYRGGRKGGAPFLWTSTRPTAEKWKTRNVRRKTDKLLQRREGNKAGEKSREEVCNWKSGRNTKARQG